MTQDWQELTKISRGGPLLVERVRLLESDIALEGSFELPPLARLTLEDQIFITAFVRSHGSIKDMEELFGISYPTVKNRLNRISHQLEFVDINPPLPQGEILEQLERGELSVDEAVKKLRGEQ
ncbi:MAG: DUF2089 domain-containing protein [Candidatus Aminicenantaceae bacterium]|jgi:hypothetical protein|nr:DUF2089 domain-containing protein [Candidatus Heimdallarchaeota archaeon]